MERLAQGYRDFATHDSPGRSPLYGELAAGVAEDREILVWLDGLPVGKRQPNLLFASYRALAGTPASWPEFRTILGEGRGEIEAQVVWRAGLDLEPIDVDDPERVRWLELLIWPGEEYRLETLRGALDVARAERPRVVQGDLTTSDLDDLAAEAPRDATLVIFHTAVLYYVPSEGRTRFRETVKRLGATWLACEAHDVLDLKGSDPFRSSTRGAAAERTANLKGSDPRKAMMALARDGERVAWADGHGTRLSWG